MRHTNSGYAELNTLPQENRNLEQGEVMALIIHGVNMLIAQACAGHLVTAAQILQTSKEELVHWSVNMNFHETSKERFVHHHLQDSGLQALGRFLSRASEIEDPKLRNDILQMLGLAMSAPLCGSKQNPQR